MGFLPRIGKPLNDVHYIQCIGKELDGSVTVISTGSGRNKRDAISQAKKTLLLNITHKKKQIAFILFICLRLLKLLHLNLWSLILTLFDIFLSILFATS